MHQTTVRFGPDLWEALEAECGRLGMSAAQYVREAALARLAYTAGQLGESDYGRAFSPGEPVAVAASLDEPSQLAEAEHAKEHSSEQLLTSTAVAAQSRLAMQRARDVRARSIELRRAIARRS